VSDAYKLDNVDRRILSLLQRQADLPLDRIAEKVDASKTTVWNRVKAMQAAGLIRGRVTLLDPNKVGIAETFFVQISTSEHSDQWLKDFTRAISNMPEIMEAHRLAGTIDYLLKVQVANTREFDAFYKRLVERVKMNDVTSSLSMETLKYETALPLGES